MRSSDSLPLLWQTLYSVACQKNQPRRNRKWHPSNCVPQRIKPAYYKITASITLNGQTIRKFSRFEFDPKTLKTAKQRVAAATAAAFEFEAKAQEEAERSLSGANKPFQEVAEEYIASAKAKLEPAALLRGQL